MTDIILKVFKIEDYLINDRERLDEMIVIFFDLDDTLYNQLTPFEKAFKAVFNIADLSISEVYISFRKYSDFVFHLSESGEMPMTDMHIYRIQKALAAFGHHITDKMAMDFQKEYEIYQQQITLSQDMIDLLDGLKESQVVLGLITNGPSRHQRDKMSQLKLANWFDDDYIFISSEVGSAKPNKVIFELAKKSVKKYKSKKMFYIGDSLSNDIQGAIGSGWQPIWLNRRGFSNENVIKDGAIVKNDYQLLVKLKELIKTKSDDIS